LTIIKSVHVETRFRTESSDNRSAKSLFVSVRHREQSG